MNLIKVYNLNEKNLIYKLDDIFLFRDNTLLMIKDEKIEKLKSLNEFVFARNTQFKYTNEDRYIYEYDLIEMKTIEYGNEISYTGILLFKKGEFYLKDLRCNNIKVAVSEVVYFKKFLSRKSITDIKYISSIIKLPCGIDYVRNNFRYEILSENNNKKNICINKEGKIFDFKEELLDEQSEISDNIRFSTDIYDSLGELIYEGDKIKFKRINKIITGIVTFFEGSYILTSLNINKDVGIIHLNNDLNKIKIYKINKIN